MNKNDECEIIIEDMGKDGEGIGHVDGFTLFVKNTVIGDRVRAKVMKAKKNLAYARMTELIEPSPFRVEPACSRARECGGCTLQHVHYDKQKELKQNHVRNCLVRIGGIADTDQRMEPLIGMEDPYHFRNKMQFPAGVDREGNPCFGFYAGHTHSLIPLADCPAGHPVNRDLIRAVRLYMKKTGASCYDETVHQGLIRHLLIRVAFATGEIMVCLVINGTEIPKQEVLIAKLVEAVEGYNARKKENMILASVVTSINTEKTNRILGTESRVIGGRGYIEDMIGTLRFRIAPEAFFQVNPVQTERLYEKVMEYSGLSGEETVWDMYCGIGTISLFLAQKAKMVYGVEIIPQAVENARENALLNQTENAVFFTGKAEEEVPRLYREDPERYRADVVVVDPPRKGCDGELISTLLDMEPLRIVYVSCDPATLARDLKILTEEKYAVERIVPVDMFPQTTHVESCVLLERVSNRKADSYVKLNVKMEGYYRIKDAEGGEADG